MSPTRDEKILAALTTRIRDLKGEYVDLTDEIEAVAAYQSALVAEAWDLHDHLVEMRATAFKVLARTRQQPASGREAA